MATKDPVKNRFRAQLRSERIRSKLSQSDLVEVLNEHHGLLLYPSVISKIEAGDRDVRIDELHALATVFGLSTDAMLGRDSRSSDVAWSASKLTSNAQRAAGEIVAIRQRLVDDAADVRSIATRHQTSARALLDAVAMTLVALEGARAQLMELSTEFPLPGVSLNQ